MRSSNALKRSAVSAGTAAGALLITALLAGCGGNLSNADLEFYYAFPDKEQLKAQLPQSGTSQAALLEDGQGLRIRDNALDVLGGTSEFYVTTRTHSDDFNNGIENVLGWVDLVRALPPTTRPDADTRVWGPYPVKDHPLFMFRFVMQRTGTHFTYALQGSRKSPVEWVDLLDGEFSTSGGARHGIGDFAFTPAGAKVAGFPLDAVGSAIDSLAVQYDTRGFPYAIAAQLVSNDTTVVPNAVYQYVKQQDGSGELIFGASQDTPTGTNALLVHSVWRADGSGQGQAVVQAGPNVNGTEKDCWGPAPAFALSYQARSWEGAEGDFSTCVDGAP